MCSSVSARPASPELQRPGQFSPDAQSGEPIVVGGARVADTGIADTTILQQGGRTEQIR
jgi:hypothetical protein